MSRKNEPESTGANSRRRAEAAPWRREGGRHNRSDGYFGRASPENPLFRGGWAAWEVAGRYSRVDLNSAGLSGGKFDCWSAALSWYATNHIRFEFDYGYGQLDNSGIERSTQFFSGLGAG